MAESQDTARVAGPYREGKRWRFRVIWPDGDSMWVSALTQDAASAKAKVLAAARRKEDTEAGAGLTLGVVAGKFIAERVAKGAWAPLTTKRAKEDLAMLGTLRELPIRRVNGDALRAFMAELDAAGVSLTSQEKRFGTVASMLRWATVRGFCDHNPLEQLDRYDRPWATRRARRLKGRGKSQLRNAAEARAYLKAALSLTTPQERVAALLPLLQLMRSGEIRHLRACDVDLQAEPPLIHVRDHDATAEEPDGWDVKGKGERRLAISPVLLYDLATLVTTAATPESLLLTAHSPVRGTKGQRAKHKNVWLSSLVKAVCEAAGVKVVTTHGLRGTATSVLAAAGVLLPDIARHCGHSDGGRTAEQHYLGSGVLERPANLGDSTT